MTAKPPAPPVDEIVIHATRVPDGALVATYVTLWDHCFFRHSIDGDFYVLQSIDPASGRPATAIDMIKALVDVLKWALPFTGREITISRQDGKRVPISASNYGPFADAYKVLAEAEAALTTAPKPVAADNTSALDLEAIERRMQVNGCGDVNCKECFHPGYTLVGNDAPALICAVKRLRAKLQRQEDH